MANFKRIFLFLLALALIGNTSAQDYRIGSYNLRYDNPRDSGNLWKDRAPFVSSLIRFHDFDILGTQEGLQHQLNDLIKALPEYEVYGAGRDDGLEKGEHSSILFKKDRFKLLKKGNFWLSETPEKPSLGWDATCCKRICSWVYLQDKKSGKKFYFFNAHFDHQGVVAREESSRLILKKIKEIAGNNPAIFTGDLNGGHETSWYKTLAESQTLKDSYAQVEHPYASNSSFNGFGSNLDRTDIIDHIFLTKQFQAVKWGILTDTYRGKFPSDHFPVMAVVRLK